MFAKPGYDIRASTQHVDANIGIEEKSHRDFSS
jgi:hypothetical protein